VDVKARFLSWPSSFPESSEISSSSSDSESKLSSSLSAGDIGNDISSVVVAMLVRRFSTSAVISSTVNKLAESLLSLLWRIVDRTLMRLKVEPSDPRRPERSVLRTVEGAGEYSCNESTRLSPVDSKGGRRGGWVSTAMLPALDERGRASADVSTSSGIAAGVVDDETVRVEGGRPLRLGLATLSRLAENGEAAPMPARA
jgi:hypothetical protein